MDAVDSGNIQVDSAIRIRYVTALEIMAGTGTWDMQGIRPA